MDSLNWFQERDRLIADTQTFVAQVAKDHPAVAATPLTVDTSAPIGINAMAARMFAPMTRGQMAGGPTKPTAPAVVAIRRPSPGTTDLREDLDARVAAFRARQQALQAERDADYEGAMGRVRAVTAGWNSRAPERQSIADQPRETPADPQIVDETWNRIWLSIVQVADGDQSATPQTSG